MGLVSPWFLAGLFAVGLPIYLHLLRQHRNTPVMWSSLMFFERRTQSSVKHRRLKYLALLSLRVILLVLLALAFANPFFNRKANAAQGRSRLLLVVDQSYSMRAGNRLAEAKRLALDTLGRRSGGEKAQVAALGLQLRMLTEPSDQNNELQGAINSIQPSDSYSSFGELVRAVRGLAASAGQPLEVHLFSDMQKSAMPTSFADLTLPPTVKLVPHPVQSKDEPNFTVETVSAPASVNDPKKARVQATIAGFGNAEAARTASLVVNGKVVGAKQVTVPPSGRATVEFQGLDVPYGFSRCEVRVDGGDVFPADDRALFAVERSDPRKVLFIHESKDSRSPLYFKAALSAAAESAFALEPVTVDQTNNLDPARFAFVVLSDVVSLPANFSDRLSKWVRGGGSVWVAAGPMSARGRSIPILEETVSEGKYYSRATERFAAVGQTDNTYPSVRRAGRLEGVKFYYVVRIEPGQSRIAARLTDQTPLLVEKRIGEGRAVFFASTFDNISNDFPLAPGFVPFVEQTARYLSGMEERAASKTVNALLELRSAREHALSVEVIDPEGKRPLSLSEATSLDTYQAQREGFYEIRRANGRHEMVAVNPDRRESDLRVIPQETMALWSGQETQTQSAGIAPTSEEATEQQHRFWWWLLLLVLAAAVAESIFASRYLGVQREEP